MTKFLTVRGFTEPVPEDMFLDAMVEAREDNTPVSDRPDDLCVPGNPQASQAREALSRALFREARRRGTFGQAAIDSQHRLDMGLPEFPDKRSNDLVFPQNSQTDSAPTDMVGWQVVYRAGIDLSKTPAHIHKSTGQKHCMLIHKISKNTGVAYCHHLKTQYFLTESPAV